MLAGFDQRIYGKQVMVTAEETTRPDLESWVESANVPETDFPIQNLPYGVFLDQQGDRGQVGIAIGDMILDPARAHALDLIGGEATQALEACREPTLNRLMALGGRHWGALRSAVSRLLRNDTEEGRAAQQAAREILLPISDVRMQLPANIGDFTDFYASVFHASNVGRMLRPDNPLMPNYKYVPVAYHGRASTVVVSDEPCIRPVGQRRGDDGEPVFGPTGAFDFETEMGFYVGPGNARSQPISIDEAEDHIFGLCLLNDWSARDIQAWEYQPLGPFLAKSFVTHVSPWVVTLDALAPFRCAALDRPEGDPAPLPYLSSPRNETGGGLDVTISVTLSSRRMREEGMDPVTLTRTNMRYLYWTIFQMLTHHASNGCSMRPGDLVGTGTLSGPTEEALGCMLEITQRGRRPVALPTGEERRFLEDGDEVTMRAWCERSGVRRIGLGECRAIITGN